MYHPHQENRSYLLSFDTSDGVGKDASVAYVWDITDVSNIIQCASYSDNNTATNEFAYVVNEMQKAYGRPWIAGEANSIGKSVLDLLRQLYHVENFVSMNKGAIGIFSHAQIKSKACRFVKNLLNNPNVNINIYHRELIDEMDWFVQKDTAKHILYSALPTKHDDHIMTMIWGLYVLNDQDISNYYTTLKFMRTELGESIPLYIQSTLNASEVDTNTRSLLDAEWRKQKKDDSKYINERKAEILKNKVVEYFDRPLVQSGVLGMMDAMDLEDDISDGAGCTFFF